MERTGKFCRDSSGWHIELDGHSCIAPDLIGFCYLDVLVRYNGEDVLNTDILDCTGGLEPPRFRGDATLQHSAPWALAEEFNVALDEEGHVPPTGTLGYQAEEFAEDVIDRKGLRAIRKELRRLEEEGQGTEARQVEEFLQKDLGPGGRSRKVRGNGDRRREMIGAAVRRAIQAISDSYLRDYFAKNVRLGSASARFFDPLTDWRLNPAWCIGVPRGGGVVPWEDPDAKINLETEEARKSSTGKPVKLADIVNLINPVKDRIRITPRLVDLAALRKPKKGNG